MWLPSKMLRRSLLASLVWLVGVCCAAAVAEPGVQSVPSLPASLGQWYKPANKRQVWLHTMFSLRRELQAVREYSQNGEWVLADKWAQRLDRHYRSLSEMVPEWGEELDLESLDRMQQALSTQNAGQLQPTLRRLEQSCQGCHSDYRALTAARYRGADFHGLMLKRPHQDPIALKDLMEQLSLEVNRIKIASEDGRWPAAVQGLGQLRAHLQLLQTSCQGCHGRYPLPAERILGQASQGSLDQLAQAIQQQDPKRSGRFLGQASVEVCARCHASHRTLYELNRYLFD